MPLYALDLDMPVEKMWLALYKKLLKSVLKILLK
jgi:hypothetical protein